MFIPTDYVLKTNVISYNVNTGRIFFTKDFWDNYSSHLLKDFFNETGVILENKMKFFAEIKRAFFEYYYFKYILKNDVEVSLYSRLTNVFQTHSRNGLPKLIVDVNREVPVYYDDEFKVQTPIDVSFNQTSHSRSSTILTSTSLSSQLQDVENTDDFSLNRNVAFSQQLDLYLQQYLTHDVNTQQLRQDYDQGHLDKYIDSLNNEIKFDTLMDISLRIYKHYDSAIGIPSIFNSFCLSEMNSGRTNVDIPLRFDLWKNNYNHIPIIKTLIWYIGFDICEHIYKNFLKTRECYYTNAYEYAFCSLLLNDVYNRVRLEYEKFENYRPFIKVASKVAENNQKTNIFTGSTRSKFLYESIDKESVFKNNNLASLSSKINESKETDQPNIGSVSVLNKDALSSDDDDTVSSLSPFKNRSKRVFFK